MKQQKRNRKPKGEKAKQHLLLSDFTSEDDSQTAFLDKNYKEIHKAVLDELEAEKSGSYMPPQESSKITFPTSFGGQPRSTWTPPTGKPTKPTTTYASQKTVDYKYRCIHDRAFVAECGKIALYGSQVARNLPPPEDRSLIIDLTGGNVKTVKIPVQGSEWWAKTVSECTHSGEYVSIAWPDMSTLPVKHTFWSVLWRMIKEQGFMAVVCSCTGGHGRTGTALACLLIASEKCKNAGDAIEFVREMYCESAIETKGQERYVFDVAKAILGKQQTQTWEQWDKVTYAKDEKVSTSRNP